MRVWVIAVRKTLKTFVARVGLCPVGHHLSVCFGIWMLHSFMSVRSVVEVGIVDRRSPATTAIQRRDVREVVVVILAVFCCGRETAEFRTLWRVVLVQDHVHRSWDSKCFPDMGFEVTFERRQQ